MTEPTARNEALLTYARMAGFLYLIIIVLGISSEVFIRRNLVEPGDLATTADNILNSTGLFRAGFIADSIMLLSDVAIAVLFYILLKPVNNYLALTAMVFRLTQATILGSNLLNYYTALLILGGVGYAGAFEQNQLQALASLFLEIHSYGYDLGLLFFAISNLFLGYLIIRANYFPSLFGYALLAAAVVYLLGSYTRFLSPDWFAVIQPAYIIPLIAELSFCLWLMIKGIQQQELSYSSEE